MAALLSESVLSIEEIKEKIVPVCEKYNIPEVHLFGSYADNTARTDSDVDLIIDDRNIHGLFSFIAAENAFSAALNKKVDLLSMAALKEQKNTYFGETVSKAAKLLFKLGE